VLARYLEAMLDIYGGDDPDSDPPLLQRAGAELKRIYEP